MTTLLPHAEGGRGTDVRRDVSVAGAWLTASGRGPAALCQAAVNVNRF